MWGFFIYIMTSRERIINAMNFREPDRVPLMCQFSMGYILLQAKISPAEFWFSGNTYRDILLNMREIHKFDGILVTLHGHDSDWLKEVREIKETGSGEMVFWKNGDRTLCPYDDLPQHFPEHESKLSHISDLNINSIPEIIEYIPVSQGLYFKIHPDNTYSIFDTIFKKAENYSIHSEITSPFDYLLDLLGHQEALIALMDYPEKCKEILQKYTNGLLLLAEGMCEKNIDAVKISSPYAGSGFISPAFYKEFVLPFESQISKGIRKKGKHVYIHTCGSIGDRLELIAESETSGIECLDPPPIGDVDLLDAKKRLGKKCFIKGNIDSVNTLLKKSELEVKRDAKERIMIGKAGSGFILSTACSIAPRVKRENILALYESVEEYGKY
jgi:uroporphyrinogen-III decarboxylase